MSDICEDFSVEMFRNTSSCNMGLLIQNSHLLMLTFIF